MAKKQYIVETYNNEKKMQKAINKMAGKGYLVDKTTVDSRITCLRKIMGGFLFARPKVYHTVTYQLIPEVTQGK